uniref:Uncharacterized protein n=1 Tax=Rangifer tarandus platyrhynchus TaxID=3082113 RepID=A0ACB0FAQ7_RANTA|nr:unnamed protein product [Rangifer tarandus platyrhynchus]
MGRGAGERPKHLKASGSGKNGGLCRVGGGKVGGGGGGYHSWNQGPLAPLLPEERPGCPSRAKSIRTPWRGAAHGFPFRCGTQEETQSPNPGGAPGGNAPAPPCERRRLHRGAAGPGRGGRGGRGGGKGRGGRASAPHGARSLPARLGGLTPRGHTVALPPRPPDAPGAPGRPARRTRPGPRGGPPVPAAGWDPPARRRQGSEAGGGSFHPRHARTHTRHVHLPSGRSPCGAPAQSTFQAKAPSFTNREPETQRGGDPDSFRPQASHSAPEKKEDAARDPQAIYARPLGQKYIGTLLYPEAKHTGVFNAYVLNDGLNVGDLSLTLEVTQDGLGGLNHYLGQLGVTSCGWRDRSPRPVASDLRREEAGSALKSRRVCPEGCDGWWWRDSGPSEARDRWALAEQLQCGPCRRKLQDEDQEELSPAQALPPRSLLRPHQQALVPSRPPPVQLRAALGSCVH